MRQDGGVIGWVRRNALGLVAIFIALGGTAVATQSVRTTKVVRLESSAHAAKKSKPGPRGPQGPPGPQGLQGPAGPSTGPAGGALAGTYPNPQIGPGAVGAAEIADFSIGPSKFAFDMPHVRATATGNQTIPNATDTVLAFNSERYDTGTLHDNATNNSRLVPPATGGQSAYLVTASVNFAANATGVRSVTLRKDGVTTLASDTRNATGAGATDITISTLTFMGGGRYVEVLVNQTSGGNLDVVKSDQQSPEFAMSYLPSND